MFHSLAVTLCWKHIRPFVLHDVLFGCFSWPCCDAIIFTISSCCHPSLSFTPGSVRDGWTDWSPVPGAFYFIFLKPTDHRILSLCLHSRQRGPSLLMNDKKSPSLFSQATPAPPSFSSSSSVRHRDTSPERTEWLNSVCVWWGSC